MTTREDPAIEPPEGWRTHDLNEGARQPEDEAALRAEAIADALWDADHLRFEPRDPQYRKVVALIRAALAAAPPLPAEPLDVERLAAARINEADREGGRTFDVSEALAWAIRFAAHYARLTPAAPAEPADD